MKLEDAWHTIMEMENSERFKPNKILSILADLGVFKTNPRIKLVLTAALYHNVWELICKASISNSDIVSLKAKLDYDGFSAWAINSIIESFWHDTHGTQESNDEIQHLNLNIKENIAHTNIPLASSDQDISHYLNSIFTVDTESFRKYGLVIQRLEPVEWKKNSGNYCDEYGASFSFEVIGNTQFHGVIEVEIYDLQGYLRSIQYLANIDIAGKYSIVNEEKTVDLYLSPQNISKIVLHIGVDSVHWENAFYGETKSILRFDGCVENETENFDILHTQFLYAKEKREKNISLFFRYKIKGIKKKNYRIGEKNLYIVLFDSNGLIRQRIPVFDAAHYYVISSMRGDDREHCAFSCQNIVSSNNPSLKLPFDEIGKIVFIEE